MRASEFEQIWRNSPFQPFTIHTDGREILVDHPEQVFLTLDKQMVVVSTPEVNLNLLDMDHISSVTVKPRSRKSSHKSAT